MGREVLDPNEVSNRLEAMPGWSLRADKLHRACKFRDFSLAERIDALLQAPGKD